MASYVIVDIEVTDPERYKQYIEVAPPTIARFGGKYIVRGGRAERLEGEWTPKRLVVLEFPTFEQAKAWWSSEDYAGPKALRQSASIADMVVVEGHG
jgi:uncharacterized protein (DUF1330 family)